MKKLFSLISIAGILLLNFSCNKTLRENEFSIKGTFTNPKNGSYVYLKEISPDNVFAIDSVKITSSGEYSFTEKMPYPTLYMVFLNDNEFITICPQSKEAIFIDADQNAFSATYTISGSPESEKLWMLNKESLKGVADLAVLAKTWDNSKEEPGKKEIRTKLDSLYFQCADEQRQYMSNFIDQNEGSLTTLIAINKQFNRKDLFSPENDLEIFEKVGIALDQYLPNNPHTIRFMKNVEKIKTLQFIQQANNLKEEE